MNKVSKALRRFWRGNSRKTKIALVFLLVTALAVAAFAVIGAIVNRGDDNPSGPAFSYLFPTVRRDDVKKILLHPKNGEEYEVLNVEWENYSSFYLAMDGVIYDKLTLDASALSYLISAAGMNLVRDPVVRAAETDEATYAAKVQEFRLSEDECAYYEITAVDRSSGEEKQVTHRVYYGSKTTSGSGYYCRLDGEKDIYPSWDATMGDVLAKGPEQLVDATVLKPVRNTTAYNYTSDLSLTRYEYYDAPGTHPAFGDLLTFTCTYRDSEPFSMTLALDETMPDLIREDLLGKVLGECIFTFSYTFPDDYGTESGSSEYAGQTVELSITSLDALMRPEPVFTFARLKKPYRDIAHRYSTYGFLSPNEATAYMPDTNAVFDAIEELSSLSGSVVRIGAIGDDVIKEYGLYRHAIVFDYPYFKTAGGYTDDNNDPIEGTYDTMENELMISDVTANGTRYIGVLYYDLVVEVDADALTFLDDSFYDFIEPELFTMENIRIAQYNFAWNYGEGLSGTDVWHLKSGVAKTSATGEAKNAVLSVTRENGEAISVSDYNQFYLQLLYILYTGDAPLSEDEIDALLSSGTNDALSMDLLLKEDNGNLIPYTYRFIPIGESRVLVAVKAGDKPLCARFTISRTKFDTLVRNYRKLLAGEAVDHNERY